MGEEALFEVEPHALDRVQLGRVGRQRQQRDVVGHRQVVSDVPSGLIGEHGHVLVVGDRGGEAIEELLHRLGIGPRHHQSEGVVGAGLDGGEDVGEREALVGKAWRALAPRPPDVADAALLADARLILEEQPNPLAFMRTLKFSQDLRGSF